MSKALDQLRSARRGGALWDRLFGWPMIILILGLGIWGIEDANNRPFNCWFSQENNIRFQAKNYPQDDPFFSAEDLARRAICGKPAEESWKLPMGHGHVRFCPAVKDLGRVYDRLAARGQLYLLAE